MNTLRQRLQAIFGDHPFRISRDGKTVAWQDGPTVPTVSHRMGAPDGLQYRRSVPLSRSSQSGIKRLVGVR